MDIKPIALIEHPQLGIAPHPLQGLGNVNGIDIENLPGVLRPDYKVVVSGSTIHGQPTWMVGVGSTKYMVDDANYVYKSTDGGATWTVIGNGSGGGSNNGSGAGQGLALWKNYLFAIGLGVDVYGPLDSSPSWTTGWVFSLSYANLPSFCPAFASIDGNLYIANGNKVHKVAEATAPFAPGTSGSYTATTAAITLGGQYNIHHIRDVGQYLALGTSIAPLSTQAFEQSADVFPYDRTTLTLGIPIKIPEDNVQQMISAKGRLYLIAGTRGKFYVTDLSTYEEVLNLPNYVIDYLYNPLSLYPGGIMFHNGKIFFTVGSNQSPNGGVGIYSYNLKTKALKLERLISTGHDGSVNGVFISAIAKVNSTQYCYGWRDIANGTYGVDYVDTTGRIASYAAFVEGGLVRVGEALQFAGMGFIEFLLTKPLASGDGVRLKWRKTLTGAWTTIGTYDFANYGAIQGKKIPVMATMTKLLTIQVRAELVGNTELMGVFAHPGE